MFERNAAVLPDTGNVDTELISLLKHLPSDTLASLLAQYNSNPAPTSGSAVLAHVFAADAKDPTSTAQQPLSPIDELRQALAAILII